MLIHTTKSWLVTGVLVLAWFATSARAQQYQPFAPIDHVDDLQLFAPADLGNFGKPPDVKEGYFFGYQRVLWDLTGVLGPTGLNAPLFNAIQQFPGAPGTPFAIGNSITDSAPDSEFAWGQRYEIGFVEGNQGWIVGILDGPNQRQSITLGFTDDNPADPANPGLFDPNADPFAGVLVGFAHSAGLLDGFIDRLAEGPNGAFGPDGIADDVNGNGVHGPNGNDADGDGIPEVIAAVDFGDLVEIPIIFNAVRMRNSVRIDGVELMRMYRFPRLHNGSILEFYYGARLLLFDDRFVFEGDGGNFDHADWDTRAENDLIGPQVAGRWYKNRGRLTFKVEGRFLAAANIQNFNQTVDFGTGVVQADLNRPINFTPFSARHARHDVQFSPVGELRAELALQVTKSMALTVGYTGLYAGNMARAASVVRYDLDTQLGIISSNGQNIFANGVNFGVEFNR